MRIAVLRNAVPRGRTGADATAKTLVEELRARGHAAEGFGIPFDPAPGAAALTNVLAARLIQVQNVDRILCLDFPAYCVPHSNKLVWVQADGEAGYGDWRRQCKGLPETAETESIWRALANAERLNLLEARRVYVDSPGQRGRFRDTFDITTELLPVPSKPILESHHKGMPNPAWDEVVRILTQ